MGDTRCMTDTSKTTAASLTDTQWDSIYNTMNPAVRDKIAAAFGEAMDQGLDILNLTNGRSPAGETVLAGFVADAREKNWSAETISMLRWNVRAVGRRIIHATVADARAELSA
jgi:hypothetical protein